MENSYPYLMKKNINQSDLGNVSISTFKTNTLNLSEGENTMNTSITNFVESVNANQNSNDSSSATPAPFHHGVPVGIYTAVIVAASNKLNAEENYDTVRVDLKIKGAPHDGHSLSKFYNQSSKDSVKFFRREMSEIGSSVKSREDLDNLSTSLVGKEIRVQVADHPSGNQVLYLKRLRAPKKTPVVDPNSFWE